MGCVNCPDQTYTVYQPRITESPCNEHPSLHPWAVLKWQVHLRNSNNQPIVGLWNAIGKNCHPDCGSFPTNFLADAPSDANGILTWTSKDATNCVAPIGCEVRIPDLSGCSGGLNWYINIEGYDPTFNEHGGLRNPDHDGSGEIGLNDIFLFQSVFNTGAPGHLGDYTGDDAINMPDLVLLQHHWATNCGQGLARDDWDEVEVGDDPLGDNSGLRLYLHVFDALPSEASIPVVEPERAISSVASGSRETNKTVVLFASGYESMRGVHVSLNWPEEWTLGQLDGELVSGQILGYPDHRLSEGRYAAAFECLSSGDIVALERFEVQAPVPGAITLELGSGEIVDCRGDLESYGSRDPFLEYLGTEERGNAATISLLSPMGGIARGGVLRYRVETERSARVKVRVYDVRGRLIRALESGRLILPGSHVFSWDGRSGDGATVTSGVYLVEFLLNDQRQVERALVVR